MSSSAISLDRDEILKEATQRAEGLSDLGAGSYVPNLDRFIPSLENEAHLTEMGRLIARERILGHTVSRLHYIEDRKNIPKIAEQKIVKPVFIVGLPRTGTTILHDILAQDPSSRAPMTWEIMFPSPPPTSATFETDPRINLCESLFPDIDAQIPGFKAMHPMGARLTQECVVMMGDTMCTPLFHNQFRVPSYQDWVDEADFAEVYAFHEMQLQHLQSGHQGDRWVLKTGAHMWGLEHLLERYPDARIVFTHRDPVESMTSYASLTALVRTMGSESVDRKEIARDWTERLHKVVNRTLDLRASREYPEALFCDIHFSDFVKDQFSVVQKIYETFGIEMSDEAAKQMRAFIEDNPKGKHGSHDYTPEEYGVDPAAVRHTFREYIDRFQLSEA